MRISVLKIVVETESHEKRLQLRLVKAERKTTRFDTQHSPLYPPLVHLLLVLRKSIYPHT
jgi:hypothetical protein